MFIPLQMIWQPYDDDLLAALPEECMVDADLWQSHSPLICFNIVEWHIPGRVMRQFGLMQTVPDNFDTNDHLHAVSRRGKVDKDWAKEMAEYVELWDGRRNRIVQGVAVVGNGLDQSYMNWYSRITRLFITPPQLGRPSNMYQPNSFSFHVMVRYLSSLF